MPDADALQGMRILLVDDDEATRYWIGRVLEREGAAVERASSVDDALAAIRRQRPHVLVCDIAMPDVDGFGLIERVRALPAAEGGTLPAVALTAYAVTPALVKASLDRGFQAHMSKPFEPVDLVRVLREITAPSGVPAEDAS